MKQRKKTKHRSKLSQEAGKTSEAKAPAAKPEAAKRDVGQGDRR